jgi:hemerythrin-like domain-containing protein
MQPIGPLMHEHRLIERMIDVMELEVERIQSGKQPNSRLIDEAIDLFRTYADHCHHGKEEEILFKELASKPLTDDEKSILAGLVEDHVKGRKLVTEIYLLNKELGRKQSHEETMKLIHLVRKLAIFYMVHIKKEDKEFFFPVMRYFTRQEMDTMLANFAIVDGRVFHEKYLSIVTDWEKQ